MLGTSQLQHSVIHRLQHYHVHCLGKISIARLGLEWRSGIWRCLTLAYVHHNNVIMLLPNNTETVSSEMECTLLHATSHASVGKSSRRVPLPQYNATSHDLQRIVCRTQCPCRIWLSTQPSRCDATRYCLNWTLKAFLQLASTVDQHH